MKPQALAILSYLRKQKKYVTSTEIVRNCHTTTPSKRLDELHDEGLIVKRKKLGRQMEYAAMEFAS